MSKIQLSQRMYSILDIVRLLDNEELSIQPKYQRRRTAWPSTAKTALMDTILNNFPLPQSLRTLIFHQMADLQKCNYKDPHQIYSLITEIHFYRILRLSIFFVAHQ